MAIVRYSPNTILATDNYTGAVTNIQDDPDAPDANWISPTDPTFNGSFRVGFANPTKGPKGGAGLQEFRCRFRTTGTGSNPGSVSVDLYENGVLRATLLPATAISSTAGIVYSLTWDSSILTDQTGAGVELLFTNTSSGGKATGRESVAVGAVEWNLDEATATVYNLSASSSTVSSNSAALKQTHGVSASSSSLSSNSATVRQIHNLSLSTSTTSGNSATVQQVMNVSASSSTLSSASAGLVLLTDGLGGAFMFGGGFLYGDGSLYGGFLTDALVHVVSESLQLLKTTLRTRILVRAVNMVLRGVESLDRLKALRAVIGESLESSETVQRLRVMYRIEDSALELRRAQVRFRARVRVLQSALRASESHEKLSALFRVLSQAINSVEARTAVRGYIRTVVERLESSEVLDKVTGFVRLITERLNTSDSFRKIKRILPAIAETVAAGEVLSRTRRVFRVVSNALHAAERYEWMRQLSKVVSNSLTARSGTRFWNVPQVVIEPVRAVVATMKNSAVVSATKTAVSVTMQGTKATVASMRSIFSKDR